MIDEGCKMRERETNNRQTIKNKRGKGGVKDER